VHGLTCKCRLLVTPDNPAHPMGHLRSQACHMIKSQALRALQRYSSPNRDFLPTQSQKGFCKLIQNESCSDEGEGKQGRGAGDVLDWSCAPTSHSRGNLAWTTMRVELRIKNRWRSRPDLHFPGQNFRRRILEGADTLYGGIARLQLAGKAHVRNLGCQVAR
jgi:hypothetical protein